MDKIFVGDEPQRRTEGWVYVSMLMMKWNLCGPFGRAVG